MKYSDLVFDLYGTLVDIDTEEAENTDALGRNAAQLFRISPIEYIELYPGVLDALAKVRGKGYDWKKLSEVLCEM